MVEITNAGGNIVPGQGLDPTFAVKGLRDGRTIGRGYSTLSYNYRQPAGNIKVRKKGELKFKTGFVDFIVDDLGRRLKELD